MRVVNAAVREHMMVAVSVACVYVVGTQFLLT